MLQGAPRTTVRRAGVDNANCTALRKGALELNYDQSSAHEPRESFWGPGTARRLRFSRPRR